ncbi:pyridoxal phosphate-dependent transferase [Hysterangium stoloniferum]|nr:pyridoxal phosphate-dependent transferase [Hysterangium stoloniferum]
MSVVCPPLGDSIPSALPHAISVSLPTWRDTVGYEEGDKRVLDAMCTGYPRFFIHKSIQKLAVVCEGKFALPNEKCLLFAKAYIAEECRKFMISRSSDSITVRLVQFLICSDGSTSTTSPVASNETPLHIVLFPFEAFPIAKQFWQHTGLGISSRMAERCLTSLEQASNAVGNGGQLSASPTSPTRYTFPTRNRHYATKKGCVTLPPTNRPPEPGVTKVLEENWIDQGTYLEERYGRNMPLDSANASKRALRRRIAGVLVHQEETSCTNDELQPSNRGVEGVTEDDVYLFPTGMAAIWSAHQLCLAALPPAKCVCFGFPYIDTLKILEKWGPGSHFFGNGDAADLDALEALLSVPGSPGILALFCELPTNPLLRSADLVRLRQLADQHGFVIVIDETIGTFVNVELLPYADILVSSLTKVFSGEVNVMGGSLTLNPKSSHYSTLKARLSESYIDAYWDEDAIYMERNSRDFIKRIRIINRNTEAVCDYLQSHVGVQNSVVKRIFYPKWVDRSNYDACRLPGTVGPDGTEEGNFGGLFSVTFTSKVAAEAFFDALPCAKGPSLGTNFTLACPYTILAHYTELPWAAQFGVEESLVRVSIGMESKALLLDWFQSSLAKAEEDAAKVEV